MAEFKDFQDNEYTVEKEEIEEIWLASQWKLIWWKFRKHKLAIFSMYVLALLYILVLFCEFIAPYNPWRRFEDYKNAPPQIIRIYDRKDGFRGPFVYGLKSEMNMETFRKMFVNDPTKKYRLRLFVRGDSYKLWGLFPNNLHL
ncbi:ABC transporter permease, partial [bacterium]|nr:ABC transporter permease [bacterium]